MSSKPLHENAIIRLNADIDLTQLKLTAHEGYLLSRLQGRTSVRELYQLSQFDRTVTATIIKRLADAKVIEIIDESIPVGGSESGAIPARDFGDYIFSLLDLNANSDLPMDVRKEALFLADQLDELTYYELFNLPSSAKPEAIKQAFLRYSKIFHPDNYFRKELGLFKEKLNAVYGKMAEANQLFSSPADVIEYRRRLIESGRIQREADDILETPEEREKRLAEEEKKRRLRHNPLNDRVNKARSFYEAGLKDEQAEQWLSAANNFRLAVSYDPQNELYKVKADSVKDAANRMQANKHYQRGLQLESFGQDGYLEAFQKAADLYPSNPEYQVKYGQYLWDQGDYRDALPYVQRAVKSAPKSKEYLLLLARTWLKLKDKKEACKPLEALLAIDPQHAQAKELLKEAKKWF